MIRIETIGDEENTVSIGGQSVSSSWFSVHCCCCVEDKKTLRFPSVDVYDFQIVAIKHTSVADDYVTLNILKGGIGENYVELEIVGNGIDSHVEVFKADT